MYAMADEDFIKWLENELKERDLSQAKLARMAGFSRSAVNGVLTGARNPGIDLCEGIARAFKLQPEEVFRKAGLLPERPKSDELTKEAEFLLTQMPEAKRQQAITFIRFLAQDKGDTNAAERMENPK